MIGSDLITIGSDLIMIGSDLIMIGSDLITIGSDLIMIGSDLITIGSDLITIGSDLIMIGSACVSPIRAIPLNVPKVPTFAQPPNSVKVEFSQGKCRQYLVLSKNIPLPAL